MDSFERAAERFEQKRQRERVENRAGNREWAITLSKQELQHAVTNLRDNLESYESYTVPGMEHVAERYAQKATNDFLKLEDLWVTKDWEHREEYIAAAGDVNDLLRRAAVLLAKIGKIDSDLPEKVRRRRS